MLVRSLRWLQRGLTTDTAATRQLTTKNIRRPAATVGLLKKERRRKQRIARGRDLYAKEAHMKSSMADVTNARDVVLAQLADQIFSKGHTHVATATNIAFVPDGNPATPLVALAGRGQVGKTSLLRSLLRSPTQVGKSNRALRRDAMNYFNVGDVFNIVDLPGYGGTSVPWSTVLQHAVLLRNLCRCQPSLKMLYYCMDVHHKNGLYVQDMDMLQFLTKEVPNFTIVITKGDQVNESDRATNLFRMADVRRELAFNDIHHPVLVTSAYRMGGIDTLRYDMVMNAVHALSTERLTLTEAKKLSARLFSQKELSTVKNLALAPTQLDDEVREWKAELAAELADAKGLEASHSAPTDPLTLPTPTPSPPASSTAEFDISPESVAEAVAVLEKNESERHLDNSTNSNHRSSDALARSSSSAVPLVFPDEPDKQAAYVSLVKKVEHTQLLQYVKATSPWRNPLHWPSHVIPTKHPKSNIMRCPEDPGNPYLTQPQFVAPRADMCFRRPNVGVRRAANKGHYEADQPMQYLLRPYTVPFFPDIVDTGMHPQPWTFLGSREAFYEKSGGRQLGVRLSLQAREGEVNPLADSPAPDNPALTHEVRQLERKCYGKSIAMLRPPDAAGSETKKDAPQLPVANADTQ